MNMKSIKNTKIKRSSKNDANEMKTKGTPHDSQSTIIIQYTG